MRFIILSMGILERLGTLVKSYVNSGDSGAYERSGSKKHADPDLDAAFDELNDFLHTNGARAADEAWNEGERTGKKKREIPEAIKRDFAELGLDPQAGAEECKEAYKRLLKVHHPDRHAKHEGNMKKATEKTSRVNAAYERLMNWFKE